MQKFIDYIEKSLPADKHNEIMFKFKRQTLNEMNERFDAASSRGIVNEKVMSDLVISEFPDLKSMYNAFYKEETAKQRSRRRLILNIVGSVTFVLCLIVAYLGISFTTKDWAHTWLIVVDGILLLIAYLMTLGVIRITKMKRIFHILARILLAIEVMVITVAVFLVCLALLHVPHAWAIVIGGIAMMFVVDGIYAGITKQKLAIINYLVYIPPVATMLYIILSAVGILAWRTGWLLIILGLLADFIVILTALAKNKKADMEVYESWKEN